MILTFGCKPTDRVAAKSKIAMDYFRFMRLLSTESPQGKFTMERMAYMKGGDGKSETTIKGGKPLQLTWTDIIDPETNCDKFAPFATLLFSDGSEYKGGYVNGVMEGRGTCKFADGAVYEGDWANNECHGQGTYTFPDGAKYVGDWRNNEMHGRGTLTFAEGGESVGNWVDGEFVE